jgi:hypothetical protein
MAGLYSRLHLRLSPCVSDQPVVAAPCVDKGLAGSRSTAGLRSRIGFLRVATRIFISNARLAGWTNEDRKDGFAVRSATFGVSERTASERVDGGLLLGAAHAQDVLYPCSDARASQRIDNACYCEPLKFSSSPFFGSLPIAACNFAQIFIPVHVI